MSGTQHVLFQSQRKLVAYYRHQLSLGMQNEVPVQARRVPALTKRSLPQANQLINRQLNLREELSRRMQD